MEGTAAAPREIAVPVSSFGALRTELSKEAGELPTIHALHHAGYAAGGASAAQLMGGANGLSSMRQETFWSRLSDFFGRRGWGTLERSVSHPGVALLSSADWAEAGPVGVTDPDASCCFSTGVLSGLLSEVAGGPVAVLEVQCRTRGDERCCFAFGSEAAIHDLYGRLLEGADLEGALAAL